jgi:cell division protein ZipA
MDVYIGFGLLSAAVVVVVFIAFDTWLKKRNSGTGLRDRNKDDDTEFSMHSSSHHLPEHLLDNVSIPEANYEMSSGVRNSELIDLCKRDDSELLAKNRQFSALDEGSSDLFDPTEESVGVSRVAHPQTIEKKNAVLAASHEKTMVFPPNLLVLSVMAQRDTRFESYDLLQAISAAGLQYGEMNIFHYYQPTAVGKIALFSLASANKPGDFDLNNIAEFSCTGLMMFMDIAQTPDPQYAFKMMLETAERLAEDLDGGLCADPMTPWNEKLAWQYHQKMMQYKITVKHDNKIFI